MLRSLASRHRVLCYAYGMGGGSEASQREWLLDGLARLIRLTGYSDFIFGRILLPDAQDFPDEWRPDLAGAKLLLARLMAHARLGSLPSLLRSEDDPSWAEDFDDDFQPMHTNTAAWFAGVNDFGTYLFGVRTRMLAEPLALAATLAHETAHAWRFRKDITEGDARVEESLTDLTTVFLGFGVLTATASGLADAALQRAGYLHRAHLSFALGVQLVLRNQPAECRGVEEALGVDQRAVVREVRGLYEANRAALIARLGLPPEAEWKRAPAVAVPPPGRLKPAVIGRDIVFRLRAPPFVGFLVASAIVGALSAAAAMSWWPLLLPLLATPAALFVRRDRCSGADCSGVIPRHAAVCPACGGRVVGRIARRSERDEAERRFLATQSGLSQDARALARSLLDAATRED